MNPVGLPLPSPLTNAVASCLPNFSTILLEM
jgi:hypothetical protein